MSHRLTPKPDFTADHGRIRLYRADAARVLASLPTGSIDLTSTDPPYSSGGLFKGDRDRDPNAKYLTDSKHATFSGDNRDQRSWTWWMSMWLGEARRVLRPGGYCQVFTDWRQLPSTTDALQAAGLTWRGIAAWDKGRASRAPHKGYHRHQCEFIAWGTHGRCEKATHDGPFDGCFSIPVERDKQHPTAKPVELMRKLVRVVPPGSMVGDWFMGCGTTAVAAIAEGHGFIGCELEAGFFEVAVDRVRKALAERKTGKRRAA